MENLKDLNLTIQDFDLINEALEHLPNKDMAGELMGTLLTAAVCRDDEDRDRLQKKMREDDLLKSRKKEEMLEDIRILQGKLFLMKRYMNQNNLLSDVDKIINK